MKRLVRLLLINWYRLDAAAIEFNGHSAFIGPNASGKSSLLDAMQTILVGGDRRQLSLNPSAGEKSTRSLRDYCLGVVRDPDNPDLSAEFRPREQAVTYLVLCFRDEKTVDEIAVGLALHARLDEPRERIDGRFIAPGLSLLLSDLTDQTPTGPVPKPWKRLREELRHRCGPRFQVVPQAGEFLRILCAELSDGRRHLDPRRFLRSFRNAITFAPIRNVSEFVRAYILEERSIRVRELQSALKTYQDIQARTREAREREQQLETIHGQYTRADQNERLGLSYRWVEQEAAFNALVAQIEPLKEDLATKERQDAKLQEQIKRLSRERLAADDAWAEAQKRLAATDVAQQKQRIAAERETASNKREAFQRQLDEARRGLRKVFRLLDNATLLPEGLALKLEPLAALLGPEEGLLEGLWPEAPGSVTAAVDGARDGLRVAGETLSQQYEALVRQEGELENELKTLRQRVQRLEAGESDLSPATQRLQALLAEHGIEAVPVCDRVDVRDERWRDATEAFLGGQREALLVAPGQVRDAVGLYRREGRRLNIHGGRIVNTLRTDDWLGGRAADSLAEMITSDDKHAVAYVNRLAGNVIRVDTEEALLRHERAVTADGMLATNGAVLRMQPQEPMLGREARGRRLVALKKKFDDRAAAYGEAQRGKQQARAFLDLDFKPFQRHVDTLPDLSDLSNQRSRCDGDLKRLGREEDALETAEYDRLKTEVARLARERQDLDARERQARDRHTQLREAIARAVKHVEDKEAELQGIAEARRRVEQTPGLDADQATQRLGELEDEQLFEGGEADAWRAVSQQAAGRAVRQEKECRSNRQKARDALSEYFARWPSEAAPPFAVEDGHRPMAAWVVGALTDLRETQLARYTREAETALREAEHAFRADFVGRLQENLAQLEEQLKELNRNLRRRPFHGQYYHFIKKPAPEFAAIVRWVETWTPEQGGDVGGLFDAAHDPNHPHREAIHRIQTLLMEAGEREGLDERLADYRHYYHFDVKMADADGGNPELLSRRLGKGSGGEHQSPFYVAIGAALAAAYRLERSPEGKITGGMALAVFDEAFSKLDVQNTVSALGFLDELGLQVILAAPDEKYGLMSEHVDTIVNVYRHGATVHIDTDYIKPAARALLAADNPVVPPDPADEPSGA